MKNSSIDLRPIHCQNLSTKQITSIVEQLDPDLIKQDRLLTEKQSNINSQKLEKSKKKFTGKGKYDVLEEELKELI